MEKQNKIPKKGTIRVKKFAKYLSMKVSIFLLWVKQVSTVSNFKRIDAFFRVILTVVKFFNGGD